MSGTPSRYRVRLAFGFYSVGHTFICPPFSRAMAEDLKRRGYLEAADDNATPTPKTVKRKKK